MTEWSANPGNVLARHKGYPWLTTRRAMSYTVRTHFVPIVLAWRCEHPLGHERFFPALLLPCWIYPCFCLLAVPARLTPRWLAMKVRQGLRQRRARENAHRLAQEWAAGSGGANTPR